ncbi:MAG: ABC transporter permease [Bacteroidetes bacterium]|jgi:ABC-2 type transport system permease protein|nr:ABC transporter permease [Bacteroidota bacterium]
MSRSRTVFEIALWEFRRWFKLKDQILALAVTCGIGLLVWGGKAWLDRSDREPVAIAIVHADLLPFTVPADSRLVFRSVPPDSEQVMREAVGQQVIDGLLVIKSVDQAELTVFRPPSWSEEVERRLTQARTETKVRALNLTPDNVADTFRPFDLRVAYDAKGSRPAGVAEKIAAGIIIGLMIIGLFVGFAYQFVTITGEKQLRVTEQIISAVSPQEWIDGKILGLSALAMASTVTYVVSSLLFIGISGAFGDMLEIPAGITDPLLVAELALFGLGGYLMWNTFFAGLAATINDPNTSAKGSLMLLPIVVTVIAAIAVVKDAGSTVSLALSFFPATAPAAMAGRLVLGDVPSWHVLASLLLLAGAIWLMRTAAGKVFQLGILMYGKEPSMKELWRWMRRL